jgi:hypothetical protein
VSAPAAIIASFALCYAGLSGLCLAMDRHHQQVLQRRGSAVWTRSLRAIGWVLLALSGLCCVVGWGVSVGVVAWSGILSAAALAIVVLLSYAPRAVARGAVSAAAIGLVMMVWVVQ